MATVPAPQARSRSIQVKHVFFVIYGLMTLFVLYRYEMPFLDSQSPIWQHFAKVKWWLLPHGLLGAIALFIAPLQFSKSVEAKAFAAASHSGKGLRRRRRRLRAGGGSYCNPPGSADAVDGGHHPIHRLDRDHGDRSLLHSHWQCAAASSVDDSQLSVRYGVHFCPDHYRHSGNCPPGRNRRRLHDLDLHCRGVLRPYVCDQLARGVSDQEALGS